ncbi:MAG: glycosyl transferase [Sphingobacterium sp.]|jgi:hypothetical protein|nr:glycosyl transferase [Sphingobacterium sp.]
MIPKKIHYCWFGRGPFPPLAIKCINSWKKYLPEYELILWNEDNFDLDKYPYAREAYQEKKFAFVTDVCRLQALYDVGGIYMDSDVEILRPLDEVLLQHTAFSGFENNLRLPTGLMGSVQGGKWVQDLLGYYKGKSFYGDDGKPDMTPNTIIISNFMKEKKGFKLNDTFQETADYCTIYPSDYFCPKSWETLKIKITANTYCIHHFAGSWLPNPMLNWRYKAVQFFLGKRNTKLVFDYYQGLKR